ncbi:MAG: hemerythrin domain-containing protein [Kofleriaceae bacterium]
MLASLAQLEKCHRRHDDVMEGLVAAARRLAAGRPDGNDVEIVRDAVSYFREAITRHFLDEEGSLFPRLSTRRPELAEQLAALSSEHPSQVRIQEQIADLASALDGDSRQGAGKDLLQLAEQLEKAHRAHVAREDHVFSLAETALTAEDDAEIVAEMTTRRERKSMADVVSDPDVTAVVPKLDLAALAGAPVARRARAQTLAESPPAKKAVAAKTVTKKKPAAKPKKPAPKKKTAAAKTKKPAMKKKPAASAKQKSKKR